MDRAAGKTGGDGVGDCVEYFVQVICIVRGIGRFRRSDICREVLTDGKSPPFWFGEQIAGFSQHVLRGGAEADRVESCDGLQVSRSGVRCIKGIFITVVTGTLIAIFSIQCRLAVSQCDDMLCGDGGDGGLIKKVLCIDKALLQIGAAVGTQAVDGFQNSGITIGSGNVLPARCYGCACTETDQRNIAAGAAGSIAIKEIDGRGLGGSRTVVVTAATLRVLVLLQAATEGGFVIRLIGFIVDTYTVANNMMIDFFYTQMCIVALYSCGNVAAISVLMLRQQAVRHRAGGIDDEHRCSLRVAGLGLGGRVHLHFQLDRVLVGGAGRLSGLVDGINAIRQIWTVCASSPDAILIIIALDYVLRFADLVRQHVQRQQRQGHDEHQDPRKQPLSCFLLRHKKILLLLPVRREEGGR